MEEHDITDHEGEQWRLDELTVMLNEDFKQTIENSGSPRCVVFSALMQLFSYDGIEICKVCDGSYAALEELLGAEQWLDHDGEDTEDEE
jgi:hypothetical protein